MNDKFVETFGYTRDQLLSANLDQMSLAANKNELTKMVNIIKRDGFLKDYPVQMVTKNGEIRDFLGSATRLKNEHKNQYIVSSVDVTEQKKTTEDLERQHVTLENEVRERTKELRKIVNVMAGRENRMADLKKIIKDLCTQLEDAGIPPNDSNEKEKYSSNERIKGEK